MDINKKLERDGNRYKQNDKEYRNRDQMFNIVTRKKNNRRQKTKEIMRNREIMQFRGRIKNRET